MKVYSHGYSYAVKLTLLFVGALLFQACTKSNTDTQEKETFQVSVPLVTDTTYTIDYVADIHAVQHVEVRSRVEAFIENIHVDEGQSVKKGQLLFSLSSQEFRDDVYKAGAILKSMIADLKAKEVDLRNVQNLVNNKVVSETELEIAQAQVDALRAKVEEAKAFESSAKLKLSFTEIRAPFDGIIDRIPKKKGSLITEGELLTFLSNVSEVIAYFNLSEREYLDYIQAEKEKHVVRLALVNGELHPHPGIVEPADGQVDKNTGNIAFRARFANPDHVIKHGSSGKVILEKEIKNAMLIPQKSTFEIQDKIFVYVVDENNVARQATINPVLRIPHFYVLQSGLKPTDKILYEGVQRVRDGDHIAIEEISTNNILAGLTEN